MKSAFRVAYEPLHFHAVISLLIVDIVQGTFQNN